jgi:hypothetical protein
MIGTGVAIVWAKAPFSSPVAGSGKPFLPSLTLPVNRDFLLKTLMIEVGFLNLDMGFKRINFSTL